MTYDKFITVYSCQCDNVYIVIQLCFCYTGSILQNGSGGTMNFQNLEYFLVVADEGNVTRAAERLHLSQQALSVQM